MYSTFVWNNNSFLALNWFDKICHYIWVSFKRFL